MTIVVGGVGQLYQGDLDIGRHVAERLAGADLGPDVVVEDFFYGAVAVMQRLGDLEPRALVLIGAEETGAEAGSVRRRRIRARPAAPWEVQDAVGAAATGHVTIELIVQVAAAFGALPPRTAAIEVEPAETGPGDRLTPVASAAVDRASILARCEVMRVRVLENAECAQQTLRRSPDVDWAPRPLLRELLDALQRFDVGGSQRVPRVEAERLRAELARDHDTPGLPGSEALASASLALAETTEALAGLEAQV